VWSLVRSFDQPQKYKPFVARCVVRGGQLEIGSLRDVNVKTGLPATTSTERLERLDDDEHLLSVKFVGGDHRLQVRTLSLSLRFLCVLCFLLALVYASLH
jgi:abscisic acid receptor PYR/PYL family